MSNKLYRCLNDNQKNNVIFDDKMWISKCIAFVLEAQLNRSSKQLKDVIGTRIGLIIFLRFLLTFSFLYFKMVKYILFLDILRKEEIDMFYDIAQMQREYYKGYPSQHHPMAYFRESQYTYQCPPEMSTCYLSFPPYHVKYKQPAVLPTTTQRTSGFPPLPERTLAGRYNKAACKAFAR